MKKTSYRICSLIIIFSIVLGSVAVLGADETTENFDFEYQLKVLETFGVNVTNVEYSALVNRENFVASLAAFLGIKSDETKIKFDDVVMSSDVGKAIALFNKHGYINGINETTFDPSSMITVEHAITVIIRVLGYSDVLQYMNCMTLAKRLGITDDFKGVGGQYLAYGDFVQMMMNLFDVPFADVDLIQKMKNGYDITYRKDTEKTAVSVNRKIHKVSGLVTATPYAHISGAKNSLEKHITLDGVSFKIKSEEDYGYLGKYVNLFYVDDGEKPFLIFALFDDPREMDRYNEISHLDIEKYDNYTLTYSSNNKLRKADIEPTADIIYNGRNLKSGEYDESLFDVEIGSITLINTDGAGKYNVVIIKSYVDCVVDYVQNDEDKFIARDIEDYDVSIIFDPRGDEVFARVVKADGSIGNIGDIKSGQILSYAKSLDEKVYDIIISEERFYGEIQFKYDDALSVVWYDGTNTKDFLEKKYELTERFKNSELCQAEVVINKLNCFYVDAFEKLAFVKDGGSGGTFYGYIMAISLKENFSGEFKLKVFKDSGEISIYDVADTVKIDGNKVKKKEKSRIETLLGNQGSFASQIAYLELNTNGEICMIDTVNADAGNPEKQLYEISPDIPVTVSGLNVGLEYRTGRFGNMLFVGNNTKIMCIPVNRSADDDDYITMNASEFNAGRQYQVRAFNRDKHDRVAGVILRDYGAALEQATDNTIIVDGKDTGVIPRSFSYVHDLKYGVVSLVTKVVNDDGEDSCKVQISSTTNVNPVDYYVDSDIVPHGIEQGVIVRYWLVGSKLTYIEPLMNLETMQMFDEPNILAYKNGAPWIYSYYIDSDKNIMRSNQSSATMPDKHNCIDMVYGGVFSFKNDVVSYVPVLKTSQAAHDESLIYNIDTAKCAPRLYDPDTYTLKTMDKKRITDYMTAGDDCTKVFGATLFGDPKALIIIE